MIHRQPLPPSVSPIEALFSQLVPVIRTRKPGEHYPFLVHCPSNPDIEKLQTLGRKLCTDLDLKPEVHICRRPKNADEALDRDPSPRLVLILCAHELGHLFQKGFIKHAVALTVPVIFITKIPPDELVTSGKWLAAFRAFCALNVISLHA